MRRLAIAIGALALAGSALAAMPVDSHLLRPGVLQVGAEFPTPGFLQGPRSKPTGYEADLVNELAKRLGIAEVRWLEAPWATLFEPGAKPFDLDIDSITITSARAKIVDFSAPYFDANLGLLVRKGAPIARARMIAALRRYRLGAETGTTGLLYVEDTIRPLHRHAYATTPGAIGAVSSGAIDGLVLDLPAAATLARQHPRLVVTSQLVTKQSYGLLFAKGNPLRADVSRVLGELRRDGTLARLQNRWFPGTTTLPAIR